MHKPVMVREIVELLIVTENGTYVDGTLGAGGHAKAILTQLGPRGRLIGVDRDKDALSMAERNLARWKRRCSFVHGNFDDLTEICSRLNVKAVDGILLDLGVSSMQLGEAERGFSFMKEGPLDMRMDRTQELTADHLIRSLSAKELSDLIKRFGEERLAGRIARTVARDRGKREVLTTSWLAGLISRAAGTGKYYSSIHPATRTFQALRIAVNRELERLNEGLEQGMALLKDGGRMAVISYHSLEDRSVKQIFRKHVGSFESLAQGGRRWNGIQPRGALVNRKPLTASIEEVAANPRARSAKLRVIERTEHVQP